MKNNTELGQKIKTVMESGNLVSDELVVEVIKDRLNKDDAKNFKLMKTSVVKTEKENWLDIIPHREDTLLEDISIFKDYLDLEERNNGFNRIWIKKWDRSEDYYLPFDEEI